MASRSSYKIILEIENILQHVSIFSIIYIFYRLLLIIMFFIVLNSVIFLW